MHHDDDLDDFTHLPSVDEIASAEEKKALWKQHSRKSPVHVPESEPEHSARDEVMEEQLVAHELPVEQEFIAEEHPSHSPEWAEDAYVQEEFVEDSPGQALPPAEGDDWVRETFELAADEPARKKRRDPELHSARVEDQIAPVVQYVEVTPEELLAIAASRRAKAEKTTDAPRAAKVATQADLIKPANPSEDDPAKEPARPESGKISEVLPSALPPPLPPIVPHVEEPVLTAKEKFRKTWEKIGGRALAASVVVHVGLLVIAAMVYITTTTERDVDFLPGGSSKGATEAAQSKQFKVQQKRNTWLKNKQPLKRVVSTSISPNLTLPEAPPDMDFPDTTKLIGSKGMSGGGMGTSGMGKGFGSGMGFGGKINFMGNTGVGRNIVFVVDVSASMSAQGDSGTGNRISRFELLKRELMKTIGRLPPNTQFQVLFFSDFAWPHNEVDSQNLKAFEKYAWNISPDKTNVRIPQFRYVTANGATVARSIQIIKDADNPGGTNWGSGLFMALKGYPKPDLIFFMTDGNKIDAEGWVDAATKLNLSGGKRTIIHTTAMMEPDAAEELDQLAKRNGGNFTIVTATGFTLTSDEFFKGRQ
jgi:von Willebrand factor type A domain